VAFCHVVILMALQPVVLKASALPEEIQIEARMLQLRPQRAEDSAIGFSEPRSFQGFSQLFQTTASSAASTEPHRRSLPRSDSILSDCSEPDIGSSKVHWALVHAVPLGMSLQSILEFFGAGLPLSVGGMLLRSLDKIFQLLVVGFADTSSRDAFEELYQMQFFDALRSERCVVLPLDHLAMFDLKLQERIVTFESCLTGPYGQPHRSDGRVCLRIELPSKPIRCLPLCPHCLERIDLSEVRNFGSRVFDSEDGFEAGRR
jgi:hypothetical protein